MNWRLLIVLLAWPGVLPAAAPHAPADGPSAAELAASVERAARSGGFRLRATVTRIGAERDVPVRVQMAGLADARHRKLVIRALGPEAIRDRAILLESATGTGLHAVAYASRETAEGRAADAYGPLYGSGLVPWDFMGQWWHWKSQVRVREDTLLDRPCTVIDSRGGAGPVTRVRSWVSPELLMPLRVEFHGEGDVLLRTIVVEKVVRRAGGAGAARVMRLVDAQGVARRFEVYDGEEGVALAPEVFSARGESEAREPQVSP